MNTLTQIRFVWKPLVFLTCLVPLFIVIGDLFEITGRLSANPIEDIQDRFGNWGLRFMMIALAVTPLRQLTGKSWIGRFRRMLGLFAFFYVFLHFLVWLVLDKQVDWAAIVEDIGLRPFITIGFAAAALSLAGQGGRPRAADLRGDTHRPARLSALAPLPGAAARGGRDPGGYLTKF